MVQWHFPAEKIFGVKPPFFKDLSNQKLYQIGLVVQSISTLLLIWMVVLIILSIKHPEKTRYLHQLVGLGTFLIIWNVGWGLIFRARWEILFVSMIALILYWIAVFSRKKSWNRQYTMTLNLFFVVFCAVLAIINLATLIYETTQYSRHFRQIQQEEEEEPEQQVTQSTRKKSKRQSKQSKKQSKRDSKQESKQQKSPSPSSSAQLLIIE